MSPYLLVTGDFVDTGGMDRANAALARGLAARGHPVHLVAHRVAEDLAALPGVHVHAVPKPADSYLLGGPLLDREGRRWAAELAPRGGRSVVNGGNCELFDVNWVHYVHAAYRPRVVGSPVRRLKGRLSHARERAREQRIIAGARLVIVNSRRTASDVIRLGVAPDRVEVVYLGVDPARFSVPDPQERLRARRVLGVRDDRPLLLFVGALGDRRKGFDRLLEAFGELCGDAAWRGDLVVIGAGQELLAWQRRARAAGLAERVHFLGFRRDVERVMQACDLLVAPSRYEAYGLVAQEALACGVPAVVSAEAGVAERYDPVSAGLLLPRAPDERAAGRLLLARLRHWAARRLRYAAAAATLGAELRATSWERCAEQMIELIEAQG